MIPINITNVYLALGNTDMRKSINGLSILVERYLAKNPFSGDLFVFCNRNRTIIKILYWDTNGFCLWQKRLEKDAFKWPDHQKDVLHIGAKELFWLLEGLDFTHAHQELTYSNIF